MVHRSVPTLSSAPLRPRRSGGDADGGFGAIAAVMDGEEGLSLYSTGKIGEGLEAPKNVMQGGCATFFGSICVFVKMWRGGVWGEVRRFAIWQGSIPPVGPNRP